MNRKQEAESIFTRVFLNLTQNYANTTTFRKLSSIGKTAIMSTLRTENNDFAFSMFNSPNYENFFIDRTSALDYFGGLKEFESTLTLQQINSFDMTVDAASIVFMHSALDAAVTDLCQVIALISPNDWFQYIKVKKVSLEEVHDISYEEIYLSKLEDYLQKIERESLMKRIDYLFALCKPPAKFSINQEFVFDKNELEKIDSTRHDIVHGTGISSSIDDVKNKIDFLLDTGLHLWGMVNERYDVRINQMYMFKK